MQNNCDLLILTARFGSGHVSVSNALKEHIHACQSNIQIEVADMHEIMHPIGYKSIYRSYEMMVRYLPSSYNAYYVGKEKLPQLQKMDTASHKNLKKLAQYIEQKKPKVVISTFPLCTGYMSKYKENYDSLLPMITCITDVVDSNEWIYPKNDLYFVADECIKAALIKKSIAESKIFSTGIPVRGKFLKEEDCNFLRSQLGYLESDRIILMMGGGFGLFPKEEAFYIWLSTLSNVKVVVLTGKNKKLYHQLVKIDAHNIRVIEYTDRVSEFMKISDVLVGKSGGITLYEAIASALPMIIYKPSLGQEIKNCQFIVDKEIGVVVYELELLKEALIKLIHNSQEKRHLHAQIQELKKSINMNLLGEKIVDVYLKSKEIE